MQGVELREAIRRNPAALAWYTGGKAVARDVAQGLAYLHKLGVVSCLAPLHCLYDLQACTALEPSA